MTEHQANWQEQFFLYLVMKTKNSSFLDFFFFLEGKKNKNFRNLKLEVKLFALIFMSEVS